MRTLLLSVGAAYAASILVPFTVACLMTGILVVHEYGHYCAAKLRDGAPDHPRVVPLGVLTVGYTRVRNLPNLSPRARRYIIAAGPLAGAIAALSIAPVVIVFGSKALVLTTFGLLAMEVYNGTLGSDGKRWRLESCRHGIT